MNQRRDTIIRKLAETNDGLLIMAVLSSLDCAYQTMMKDETAFKEEYSPYAAECIKEINK